MEHKCGNFKDCFHAVTTRVTLVTQPKSWLNESYGLLPWCFCILYWRLKASITYLLEKKDQHSLQNSFTQVLFDQLIHWPLIKAYRFCLCNKPTTEAFSSEEKLNSKTQQYLTILLWSDSAEPSSRRRATGPICGLWFQISHNKSHADIFLTAEAQQKYQLSLGGGVWEQSCHSAFVYHKRLLLPLDPFQIKPVYKLNYKILKCLCSSVVLIHRKVEFTQMPGLGRITAPWGFLLWPPWHFITFNLPSKGHSKLDYKTKTVLKLIFSMGYEEKIFVMCWIPMKMKTRLRSWRSAETGH